jgi:hypothetical protein
MPDISGFQKDLKKPTAMKEENVRIQLIIKRKFKCYEVQEVGSWEAQFRKQAEGGRNRGA